MKSDDLSSADTTQALGTAISLLSNRIAQYADDSEFAKRMKCSQATHEEYIDYISFMYPVVFTFNRALIRSIAKLDNVRQSSIVERLAEQLQEEQKHNAIYRDMLAANHLDHMAIYESFTTDQIRHEKRSLDVILNKTLAMIDSHQPFVPLRSGRFPHLIFVLCRTLMQTATDPGITFWEHYACQSGLESVIFEVVSSSIYPGILTSRNLIARPDAIAWWKEHARHNDEIKKKRSDEEKHLAISRLLLNRHVVDPALITKAYSRASDVMWLLGATTRCVKLSSTI